MKSARQAYKTRSILLIGDAQRGLAMSAIGNAPIDPDRPIECVLRERSKARSLDQNAAMWAGPLRDIAEQAWVDGRRYSAEVWAEHFKREYLPEADDDHLELLVKEPFAYKKWDVTPKGDRILVGSTTQLTERGFGQYMTQIEAEGAGLGVAFSVSPNQYPRAA